MLLCILPFQSFPKLVSEKSFSFNVISASAEFHLAKRSDRAGTVPVSENVGRQREKADFSEDKKKIDFIWECLC